ncbi:hypothetical protein ACIG87_26525 [Micromonospora sp. NPDC051925]|uniref:hypothetical protein n=1 Tax=Micromonospora sp. NPDC051925 TaxID=3364288 RepID=UPI0037C7F824
MLPRSGTLNGGSHRYPATIAWDCATGNATDDDVVNGGTVPLCPPPAQLTNQVTVARSVNTAPGAPAELTRYVCPHDDTACGSVPARHGNPGPWHTTSAVPSPGLHTTRTGVAVAVTDIPGTDAVARRTPHVGPSTHSHTGT